MMALNLKAFRSHVFQLTSQEGFLEVAKLVQEGKLQADKYRFIVLMFGRADLWLPDRDFRQNIGQCIEVIRAVNPDAIVVLCATLPNPQDSKHTIRIATDRNNYLSLLSAEGPKLQFSKPGKNLFVSGGPSPAFYAENGNLNLVGLELIRYGIENKFRCANLRGRQS